MQPYKPLSYAQLLDRARSETASLKGQINDLENQDYELSRLRQRIDIKDFEAFYAQRREINANIIWLKADLARSQGRETILRRVIAAGEKRLMGLVAAA